MKLQQLEKAYGSDSEIARALNVSRQLVAWWRSKGQISKARQAYIEVVTRGRFKADGVDREGSLR